MISEPKKLESRVCARCVMNQTAQDITFDSDGNCNFCSEFLSRSGHLFSLEYDSGEKKITKLVEKIKLDGRKKKYDCIVGVSGGVDSSWVLVNAIKLGLRPLAVHVDNGWNSELSQKNIENLIKALNVDLYTCVLDWGEYRSLMGAFLDADVVDLELLIDNAIIAMNYRIAKKFKTNFILAGTNQSTEGINMPTGWNWFKLDKKNIKSIYFSKKRSRLKKFPAIGVVEFIIHEYFFKRKWIPFLDYLDYKKDIALTCLEKDYGYIRYPYKHYESVLTRFYQGYILPTKFGIDKRRLHLSTLIATKQMSRNDALTDLKSLPYKDSRDLNADKKYFQKKMGWNDLAFEEYISRPSVSHAIYGSERWLWELLFLNPKFRAFAGYLKKLKSVAFRKK